MSIIHKAAVLVATAALAIGLNANSQPAHATPADTAVSQAASPVGGAYGCSGNLIEQVPLISQWGTLYGDLDLYWDGTNNCAVTVHAPGYQGASLWTEVMIFSYPIGGTMETPYEVKYDENYYSSYAGPVSVYGAGRCVGAMAYISNLTVETHSHCG